MFPPNLLLAPVVPWKTARGTVIHATNLPTEDEPRFLRIQTNVLVSALLGVV